VEEHDVVTAMTPAVQKATDRVVRILLLWAIPCWIRPNYLTFLRFALIPVIIVLLHLDHPWWALGVLVAAVCTDFIDGAMARTRNQITVLGTYIDPVADKLLVGVVLGWIGYRYVVVDIILAFILLELTLSAIGARILLRTRTARSSNAFGKSKMVVQSVVLFVFLVSGILGLDVLTTVALDLLWLALALAFASGILQMQGVLKKRVEQKQHDERPPVPPGPGA
jgi:CDP-diacylglycerol--glycerol-3-phosphate 3-phosphatidyltransferase